MKSSIFWIFIGAIISANSFNSLGQNPHDSIIVIHQSENLIEIVKPLFPEIEKKIEDEYDVCNTGIEDGYIIFDTNLVWEYINVDENTTFEIRVTSDTIVFNEKIYSKFIFTTEGEILHYFYYSLDSENYYIFIDSTKSESLLIPNDSVLNWVDSNSLGVHILTSIDANIKTPSCDYHNLIEAKSIGINNGKYALLNYYKKGTGLVACTINNNLVFYLANIYRKKRSPPEDGAR